MTTLMHPATAADVIRQQHDFPEARQLHAGDVASAFRNVCTHSESAHLFCGRLERDNALVIDTAAAFGWSGSPGSYGVVVVLLPTCMTILLTSFSRPDSLITVGSTIISTSLQTSGLLLRRGAVSRHSMITVLGPGAVNEEEVHIVSSRQKSLVDI
ncbi:hypothetical protein GQ600_3892 [Phytophthora cactorum]|nr:hypothetical protein GQ600_3892 [Phytophthora cactorum]